MASAILHIKDGYYFEVPKALWTANYRSLSEFPDVWVQLDPEFQDWEAERLYEMLTQPQPTPNGQSSKALVDDAPALARLKAEWHAWQHGDHANFGRPLDVFLEMKYEQLQGEYRQWSKQDQANADKKFVDFLNRPETQAPYKWFAWRYDDPQWRVRWEAAKEQASAVAEYKSDESHSWSREKIQQYNKALSGKILIPQPFGTLRNLHEPESGFCISKFMIIQVIVALVIVGVFSWLGRRVASGGAPRGRLWNLLEVILVYLRDHVARPAIGEHDADRFVPLLWTIFVFVLGCNLFGMLPWLGAPTGAFGVTFGMACVTFGTVMVAGMLRFGVLGFFKNQIPGMDLPLPLAILIKPMILAIELLGLCIRHMVLAVRLLANMVAGHLVLLGIMGLAFGAEAAISFADSATWQWGLTAVIAVVSSTLFSGLELFVAFLQAYIFTFLSALFIGASIHHH